MARAAITSGPSGRTGRTGRRGRGSRRFTGTVFRVGSSLVDYLLLTLAQRFMTPWLLAFAALPLLGQFWHAAWGGKWWTWLIAAGWVCYGMFEAWVTIGGRLFAGMFSALSAGDTSKGWRSTLAKIRISGEAAARGSHIRWRAGLTIAFAVLGLAAIMTCGLVHNPQMFVELHRAADGNPSLTWQWPLNLNDMIAIPYLALAVPLCISWNKARSAMVAGSGEDDHDAAAAQPLPVLSQVLGIDKPVDIVGQSKDSELGRVETKVSHPGVTTEQIQSGLGSLASEARLPRDGHAVLKGSLSHESTIVTMSWSTLDVPQQWLGPYNRGESISEPVRVGLKQNGKHLENTRAPSRPKRKGASPARNGRSMLIQGYTGAGKTEAVVTEFAESISRRDAVWWWVDVTKAGATADDIRPGLDWLATSDPEAVNMVDSLEALIAYRSVALRRVGLREWEPRAWELAGIPFLIVHIEEINSVIEAFDKRIIRRAEAVRSAGISLSCSSQRASGDNMPTGLRSQLGCGWEFGLKDADDIAFCLSPETIKAGADAPWADTVQGQCYLEAAHIPRDEWAIPGRTFDRIPPEVLRRHVAHEVTRGERGDFPWPTLTPGEVAALGPHYAARAVSDLPAWIEANAVDMSVSVEELRELVAAVDAATEEEPAVAILPPPHDGNGQADDDDADDDEEPPTVAAPPRGPADTVDTLTDPAAAADAARRRAKAEEDRMREADRAEAEAAVEKRRRARHDDDPDIDVRSLMSRGSGLRPDRPLDDLIVDPDDDIEFGTPPGAVPMDTPEQRNAALDAVLRELFERKAMPDRIEVDTKALGELWADAGGFSTGNRSASLLYRLNILVEKGFAFRIREGRGRKPAQWQILRAAIEPPAEIVDTEPDLDDLSEDDKS